MDLLVLPKKLYFVLRHFSSTFLTFGTIDWSEIDRLAAGAVFCSMIGLNGATLVFELRAGFRLFFYGFARLHPYAPLGERSLKEIGQFRLDR